MKKKNKSILVLTALFISLLALWKATGASWMVWAAAGVTAVDVIVFLKM